MKTECGDTTGTSADAKTRQDQEGERVSNAVRRTRSPLQGSQEDQRSGRYSSRYLLRVRQSRNEGSKVRNEGTTGYEWWSPRCLELGMAYS